MNYTLHLARGTVALASHIALEEIGVPHDLTWLDFRAEEQRGDAFARINPKRRVPVLVTPHGPLTETRAILNYLVATHPEADLMPADPFSRARIDEMSSYLASTVHVNHAHGRRAGRWADDSDAKEAMAAKVPQTMTESAAILEASLGNGPWVLGERYSTADMHLFAIARWMEPDGVDLSSFAALRAHSAAMAARPAVHRAVALHL